MVPIDFHSIFFNYRSQRLPSFIKISSVLQIKEIYLSLKPHKGEQIIIDFSCLGELSL